MGCQVLSIRSVDCRLKDLGFTAPSVITEGVESAAYEESDQYPL